MQGSPFPSSEEHADFTPKRQKRLADELRFIRSWFESPRTIGAVMPSGQALARVMAQCVIPNDHRAIIELGPGTGPVTQALLERGVAPERLVLVEYEAEFCQLLKDRFPKTRVLQGDAYRLSQTLRDFHGPAAAVVSSLPLLTRPEADRAALLRDAFHIMGPHGSFIQFTYGLSSPMPLKKDRKLGAEFCAESTYPIWRNLPPARVWRYTHAEGDHGQHPHLPGKILGPKALLHKLRSARTRRE